MSGLTFWEDAIFAKDQPGLVEEQTSGLLFYQSAELYIFLKFSLPHMTDFNDPPEI